MAVPSVLAVVEIGHTIDYAIILAYLVGILLFGLAFSSYAKTTSDYFFGGRRFSWWLVGVSYVATTVGSYSFIKYSQKAYQFGFSSTQTYLNDWFLMPLFMFGWLPIIYFSRVTSVPEYFERRFDRTSRVLSTFIILLYMVGYIGYNFFMLGTALRTMLGWPILIGAGVVAIICAVYMHLGGQTSVIMTDLAQGVILLAAGFLLLFLGVSEMGEYGGFWSHFPPPFRTAFAGLNTPASFPAIGIFWQDGMANGVAFYFMNQGILMRFMCAKTVREGRKAAVFIVFLLMPLAAIAVSNAGWIGRAMVHAGLLPADVSADDIFVIVSNRIGGVGFFGLLMAALLAALMSTTDSLINAVSAVSVNDIYRPFIRRNASDKHYLEAARVTAILAAVAGLALVPLFMSFKDMYVAHANFVATVTPPMVVAIILGAVWKRFTRTAAVATLGGGALCMILTYTPIGGTLMGLVAQGIPPAGYTYMRSLFGIVACTAIGITVTFLTKPEPEEKIEGLVMGSIRRAKERLKGGPPNDEPGGTIVLRVATAARSEDERDVAILHPDDLARLRAAPGDLLYAADPRRWLGGLRSVHLRAGEAGEAGGEPGTIVLDPSTLEHGRLGPQERVRVEKIM
ncbi:MAG: sodium/solute symporter [Planctomycetes bacterium]|nr:sodium/solute symporter [Planctomycetota bacterium]